MAPTRSQNASQAQKDCCAGIKVEPKVKQSVGTSVDVSFNRKRVYSLEDKLEDVKFTAEFVKVYEDGRDFDYTHVQKNGFLNPVFFRSAEELHLHVPGRDFSIKDIRACVCSRRLLEVTDTGNMRKMEMTMKEFHKYWDSSPRSDILSVDSLEFSHTKLENFVKAPFIVRQLDWIDRVWPRHLKLMQSEPTNNLERMMYPKVQKYVLMAAKGSFCDFHMDIGGCSAWYHVLKGKRIFWLIGPTHENVAKFESWVKEKKDEKEFFADAVSECQKISVEAGNTILIPSGWIYAVYSPEDSIAFCGYFLHSFSIQRQLDVAITEEITKVPQKNRFPFYTEMLWFVLAHYVHFLLGKRHICGSEIATDETENKENAGAGGRVPSNSSDPSWTHITEREVGGLHAIVVYFYKLPENRVHVPDMLPDPCGLIADVRTVVKEHMNDNQEKAVTGFPLFRWPGEFKDKASQVVSRRNVHFSDILKPGSIADDGDAPDESDSAESEERRPRRQRTRMTPNTKKRVLGGKLQKLSKAKAAKRTPGVKKRRRMRCWKCEPCTRPDCEVCAFCKDMPKYGGLGRMKQTCQNRQCINPLLPSSSACDHCGNTNADLDLPMDDVEKSIYECSGCLSLLHRTCAAEKYPDRQGQISEAMKTLWLCPLCVEQGVEGVLCESRLKKVQGMKERMNAGSLPPVPQGAKRKKFMKRMPAKKPVSSDEKDEESSSSEAEITKSAPSTSRSSARRSSGAGAMTGPGPSKRPPPKKRPRAASKASGSGTGTENGSGTSSESLSSSDEGGGGQRPSTSTGFGRSDSDNGGSQKKGKKFSFGRRQYDSENDSGTKPSNSVTGVARSRRSMSRQRK